MPEITFPTVDINKAATDFGNALKEGAYVAVGLGVLGFQRAQVQRVELTRQLEEARGQLAKAASADQPPLGDLGRQLTEAGQALEGQLESARAQLAELARALDERMQPARKELGEQLDRFEQSLPAAARNVVQSVRAAAATPEQMLRSAVGIA
jgi:ABC-type transporter Mla subunit MlaD